MIASRSACLSAIALSALGLCSQTGQKFAIVNESRSLQEGLYLRRPFAPVRPGDVVALKPPPASRDYLAKLGAPGGMLLLKRVAAREGDLVCAIGGQLLTPTTQVKIRLQDGHGRLLPQWPGCQRLAAGELFLLGDSPDSFDSRYFGPVRTRELAGVFALAVSW